jgi:hypothetical protein
LPTSSVSCKNGTVIVVSPPVSPPRDKTVTVPPPQNTPPPTTPSNFVTDANGCTSMDSKTGNKHTVVFIPDSYKDKTQWDHDTREAMNILETQTNLGDLYKKIRIKRYENFDTYSVYYKPDNPVLFFDEMDKAVSVMRKCEGDSFVLASSIKPPLTNYSAGSTYGKGSGHVVILQESMLDYGVAHELGHAIAGLEDEYVYSDYSKTPPELRQSNGLTPTSNNCKATQTECKDWETVYGTAYAQCLEGCTYKDWYRPADGYIMRQDSKVFDPQSIDAWKQSLGAYE